MTSHISTPAVQAPFHRVADIIDAAASTPPSDDDARALAAVIVAGASANARTNAKIDKDVPAPSPLIHRLMQAAAQRRDRHWGFTLTFSPKVFLPLTNLCRNFCDYCAFRRSPNQAGAWTMTPAEVIAWLDRAQEQGCVEALFCLGDTPETTFRSYGEQLAQWGHASTVDYLVWASEEALARGLLPHTNAGVLSAADLAQLKRVNASLGLMLENVSPRLCQKGMPHHRAPDKRPERRLAVLDDAGTLDIAFTTGLLIGIGETVAEQIDTLLAIRDLHRRYGHIQEVIVQNFRAHSGTTMANAPEPGDDEIAHAVALARLILDDDISVQAPPNLNPDAAALLIGAGINDFGGISPVTPDYINPSHPWPHLDNLARISAQFGRRLRARLPVYDRFTAPTAPYLSARIHDSIAAVQTRLDALQTRIDAAATSPAPARDADEAQRHAR